MEDLLQKNKGVKIKKEEDMQSRKTQETDNENAQDDSFKKKQQQKQQQASSGAVSLQSNQHRGGRSESSRPGKVSPRQFNLQNTLCGDVNS